MENEERIGDIEKQLESSAGNETAKLNAQILCLMVRGLGRVSSDIADIRERLDRLENQRLM